MKTPQFPVHAVVIALLLTTTTAAAAQSSAAPLAPTPASAPYAMPTDQEPELLELLDTSLGSLAEWNERNRRVGGWVMLGLGAATAVGGVVTLAAWDHEDADVVGYSLIGGGLVLGGLSLLPFKIKSETERIYDEFREMPAGTAAEIRTKFAYGDRRFEELARNRRTGRYISGAVLLGIGITDLFVDDDTNQWIGFGTPIVAGLTTLLVKTEEERRYESYQRAKEDLVGPTGSASVQAGLTVLPRHGLAAVVQLRF